VAARKLADASAGDVRRQGGWLPGNQDELEAWLAGHRERVAAKGERVPLHPVLAEFQALIDSDPVVRMYLPAWLVCRLAGGCEPAEAF
jgi:phosphatidylserine decarboxylase